MAKISSSIKSDRYKVEITSPTGNLVIADEPVAKGGNDLFFYQIACTRIDTYQFNSANV